MIAIAICALFVSVANVVWTYVKSYRLEGGRVIVTFRPALWDPETSVLKEDTRDGRLHSPDSSALSEGFRTHRGVECAELTIDNAGRVGVTVLEVGISYHGGQRRGGTGIGRWRRQRAHIVPRMFQAKNFNIPGSAEPFRLEPYSRVVYLLDVHTVIDAARNSAPRRPESVLRAAVTVAGQRAQARSSWRRRWRVPAEAASLVDYSSTVSAESAILLIIVRSFNRREPGITQPEYLSRLIAAGLWENRELSNDRSEQVEKTLGDRDIREILEEIDLITMRFQLEELLRKDSEKLSWSGAEKQVELIRAAAESRNRLESNIQRRLPRAKNEHRNDWIP